MKDKIYYSIMIIVFILLVVASTITFLVINNSETGTSKFIKKYYDIMFVNTTLNNNDMIVKVDNDKDSIHIEIPNLNEINNNTFSLDVKNIGNEDVVVNNYSFSNIDTNINSNDIEVLVSLNKDEIIRGSSDKKLNVTINYKGNDKNITPYYNFNINYLFDEVIYTENN